MCLIRTKTYVYPNGHKDVEENVRFCLHSDGEHPCRWSTREDDGERRVIESDPTSPSSNSKRDSIPSPASFNFPPTPPDGAAELELRAPRTPERRQSFKGNDGKHRRYLAQLEVNFGPKRGRERKYAHRRAASSTSARSAPSARSSRSSVVIVDEDDYSPSQTRSAYGHNDNYLSPSSAANGETGSPHYITRAPAPPFTRPSSRPDSSASSRQRTSSEGAATLSRTAPVPGSPTLNRRRHRASVVINDARFPSPPPHAPSPPPTFSPSPKVVAQEAKRIQEEEDHKLAQALSAIELEDKGEQARLAKLEMGRFQSRAEQRAEQRFAEAEMDRARVREEARQQKAREREEQERRETDKKELERLQKEKDDCRAKLNALAEQFERERREDERLEAEHLRARRNAQAAERETLRFRRATLSGGRPTGRVATDAEIRESRMRRERAEGERLSNQQQQQQLEREFRQVQDNIRTLEERIRRREVNADERREPYPRLDLSSTASTVGASGSDHRPLPRPRSNTRPSQRPIEIVQESRPRPRADSIRDRGQRVVETSRTERPRPRSIHVQRPIEIVQESRPRPRSQEPRLPSDEATPRSRPRSILLQRPVDIFQEPRAGPAEVTEKSNVERLRERGQRVIEAEQAREKGRTLQDRLSENGSGKEEDGSDGGRRKKKYWK